MAANEALRRPRRGRRMFVGAVRILALLSILVGISLILVPALAHSLAFYGVALAFAITTFVLLRPRPHEFAPPSQTTVLLPPPEPIYIVDEAKIAEAREAERTRWTAEVAKSVDAVRHVRNELSTSEETRASLAQNVEELTQTLMSLRRQVAGLQTEGARKAVDTDNVIGQLNQEIASARSREAELNESFKKAIEESRGNHERDLKDRDAKLNEIRRALDSERGVRKEVESLARELQKQLTDTAASQGDLHRTIDGERAARAKVESHARELMGRIEHLERIDAESTEKHTARETEIASLTARIAELQVALESERAARDEREEQRDAERAKAAGLEAELEKSDVEWKDRVAAVESQLASREAEWNVKLQKIVSGLATDHENDLGKAIEEREAAKAEARSHAKRVGDLEAQHAARETEWNEKLQKIVSGMATDHESDVGEALEQREAAKAEARAMATRVSDLERQLATHEEEWSNKLQTIVSHLASDHEADIGKALEQKEEARAEARTLNSKIVMLQQQVERDRQMFLAAQEKWNGVRDALNAQVEAAKRELEDLKRQQTGYIPTPEPFPSPFNAPPQDAQKARAEVLEFAEQAHAVLKRTSPGTVAIPRTDRRALILFVHHDPNMRTMWRDQLHRHGYDVVTAADGLEGLRMANAQKPDVVIADAQMPKMDGRELCRLLKSNEQTATVKIILMTAAGGNALPAEGFPPDDVVQKPVKFEALQNALANLLAVSS